MTNMKTQSSTPKYTSPPNIMQHLVFLVVDDEENYLALIRALLADLGAVHVNTFQSAYKAREWAWRNTYHVALIDAKMKEMPGMDLIKELFPGSGGAFFVLITAYAELTASLDALRNNLFDLILKPFGVHELEVMLERVRKSMELKEKNEFLRVMLKESENRPRLLGVSKAIQEARAKIRLFAQHFEPALITGETGVGKELVARAMHEEGQRAKFNFVAINCSAFPETMLESELFGHERGAFTGAERQRVGKLELAGRGTVMLDEVCEIQPQIQVKLLRVLQEKEFERLGGNSLIRMQARVISATNRNIEEAIQSGFMRQDFYYRINRLRIHIPPLRERPEDIEYLAMNYLRGFSLLHGKIISGFSDETLRALLAHPWPGNVRQLQSVIDYAALCCGGEQVALADLPQSFFKDDGGKKPGAAPAEPALGGNIPMYLESYERKKILDALNNNKWNRSKAAREVGLTRSQLMYRIKKYGL